MINTSVLKALSLQYYLKKHCRVWPFYYIRFLFILLYYILLYLIWKWTNNLSEILSCHSPCLVQKYTLKKIFHVLTNFEHHIKFSDGDFHSGALTLHHSMSSCSAAVRHWAVQWVLCVMCQLWEWVGRRCSSQARQAGVDQLCDTATPRASRPREGSQVQLPRLLGTQEP